MAYQRNITAADKVFYDTDRILSYAIYAGDPTEAAILAGTATPVDVSTWALGWTLRRKPNSADPPLIEKFSSGSPAGIIVTGTFNADPEVNTQRVEVTLLDTDTYDPDASPIVNLKAGRYVYGLKRLDDGFEAILAWGSFDLLQAAPWE